MPPVKPPSPERSEAELADALCRAIFGSDPPELPARSRPRQRGTRFGPEAFGRALNLALERAAVTGRFLPAEIVPDAEKSLAEAVLSKIEQNCDVEMHDRNRVWLLGRELRRDTLARLWHEDDKPHVASLTSQIPAHPWDDAGRYLQSILKEGKLPNPSSSLPAMCALAQAYDWVSQIVDVKAADLALRQSIAFRSLIEDNDKLLKQGFFGRTQEIDQFERFWRADREELARYPPVLTITGIGGSGKSTFLAKVCRDLLVRRGQGVPAVFSIDFDRFGLGPNSLIELTFEVMRQIALYDPGLTDEFAQLRVELREELAKEVGSERRASRRNELSIKFLSDLLGRVGRVIASLDWRYREAILVLDTFEELQAKRVDPDSAGTSGVYATNQIATWIRALVADVGLERLRVVVSGRAPVDLESHLAALVVDSIDLGDLDPADAVLLLINSGLSPDAAEQLQRLVGGNPLLLRIAARLIRKLPPKKRSAILQELASERVDFDPELVQGVLYDRILQHIRDEKVRNLAHPGLVLRRVTWRLIRDVLAEPCGLGAVDDAEAKRLFDGLADEVWLVERDPEARSDVLIHRKDIRRLMLRLMAKDPAGMPGSTRGWQNRPKERHGADIIRDIHRRALDFYTDPAGAEDASVARAEALYHRMMLVDDTAAEHVTSQEISEIAASFGGDVDLLTPALRLRVRRLTGQPLTLDEALLLPEDDWRSYAYREGLARLDERQEPASALALVARRAVADQDKTPEWHLRALDAAVRWDVPDDAWLEQVGTPRAPPSASPEEWPAHSAAKSLLLFRRRAYAAAMAVVHAVVIEMRSAVRDFARAQDKLADYLRCANYALLARAAYRNASPDLGVLLGDLVQAEWPFSELGPITNPALDLELRRYAALTWRPGAKLVPAPPLTRHAFVPEPDWLRKVAAAHGASAFADAFLAGIGTEPTVVDLLSVKANEFADQLPSSLRSPTVSLVPEAPSDDFDAMMLRGDNPEMRPSVKYALRQAFPAHRDLYRLAELTIPHLPIVPTDLQPSAFARPDQLPAHRIAVLVEYADRSRVLGRVLDAAARERPMSEALERVSASFASWDAAFARTIRDNRAARAESPRTGEPIQEPDLSTQEMAASGELTPNVDMSHRQGYDPFFLGIEIPPPAPKPELAADAHPTVLNYCRFSVLLSRQSRLPIYAAANISYDFSNVLPQSLDVEALGVQALDPRLKREEQRLVPPGASFAFAIPPKHLAYGEIEQSMIAIGDARFVPNHIPVEPSHPEPSMHASPKGLWVDIDFNVAFSSRHPERRIVLFAGADTPALRWKVMATSVETGIAAAAFTLELFREQRQYRIHQVRVRDLQSRLGLSFGMLVDNDVLGQSGAARAALLIEKKGDVHFPNQPDRPAAR